MLVEPVAEVLDAGGVAQVDAVDQEPVAPGLEVRLAGVAGRGVVREAGAGHHGAAGAQQQDGRLVADLHPGPGDQGHAAPQVRRGPPPGLVLVAAGRAELVVEAVDAAVLPLAHVAAPWRVELGAGLRARRDRRDRRAGGPPLLRERGEGRLRRGARQHGPPARGVAAAGRQGREWRPEDWLLAEAADPAPAAQGLVPLLPGQLGVAQQRLLEPLARLEIRSGHLAGEPLQRAPGRLAHRRQQGPVAGHGGEDSRGGLDVGRGRRALRGGGVGRRRGRVVGGAVGAGHGPSIPGAGRGR